MRRSLLRTRTPGRPARSSTAQVAASDRVRKRFCSAVRWKSYARIVCDPYSTRPHHRATQLCTAACPGTEFAPVTVKGKTHCPGQVNNVYVFAAQPCGGLVGTSCAALRVRGLGLTLVSHWPQPHPARHVLGGTWRYLAVLGGTWRYLAGKGSLRPGISSRRCRLRQCNAERGKRSPKTKHRRFGFQYSIRTGVGNPNRFRRTVREITDRLFLVAAEGVANSLDASDLQAPVAHAASGMQHATLHAACSVKLAMHHAHCGQRSRVIQLRCMCRRTGWCPTLNGFVKYR